ncbi:hypothetical protein G9A89_009690 [Geosiphon pyriformis]|nr:hypothetical protein G9A89_009690 [Geosiphon pyriformis]
MSDLQDTEDLLNLQEEFLRKQIKPAATVIKRPQIQTKSVLQHKKPGQARLVRERENVSLETRSVDESIQLQANLAQGKGKKSIFARRQELNSQNLIGQTSSERPLEEHVPAVKKVLDMHSYQSSTISLVKENDTSGTVLPPTPTFHSYTGFPLPVRRNVVSLKKRKSTQDSETGHGENEDILMETHHVIDDDSQKYLENTDSPGSINDSIHEENLKRLANMSEDEILQAQTFLRQALNPDYLKKLLSKSTHPKTAEEEGLEKYQSNELGTSKNLQKRVHFVDSEYSSKDKFEDTMELKGSNEADDSLPLVMKTKYFSDIPAEPEKLEWMGISNDTKQTQFDPNSTSFRSYTPGPKDPMAASYRFDFKGNILAKDMNISVYYGLHHHGDDPDQPGYTIAELLHLTRSNMRSQRIIPLNILGRIFMKIRKGFYGDDIAQGIVEWMIKLNALMYLRSALDDTHESAIVAAIDALSGWVIGSLEDFKKEEKLWDLVGNLHRGYENVFLFETKTSKTTKKFGMEMRIDENIQDFENPMDDNTMDHEKLLAEDLVEGLLAMNVLDRFRYLLDKYILPRITIEQIISMMLRLARHSLKSVQKILNCSRLLELIHAKYICLTWPVAQSPIIMSDEAKSLSLISSSRLLMPNYPFVVAVKLLRVMCQSSKNISQDLMKRNYINKLSRYVLVSYSALKSEFDVLIGHELFLETFRIYIILTAYGMHQEVLSSLYTVFPSMIQTIYEIKMPWEWSVKDSGKNQKQQKNEIELSEMRRKINIAIGFFRLMETWMFSLTTHHKMSKIQSLEIIDNCSKGEARPSEFLNDAVELLHQWTFGIPNSIEWFKALQDDDHELAITLISSASAYIASWCEHLRDYPLKDISVISNIWNRLNLGKCHTLPFLEYLRKRMECANMISSNEFNFTTRFWQLPNLPGAYHPRTWNVLSAELRRSVISDCVSSQISLINQTAWFLWDKENQQGVIISEAFNVLNAIFPFLEMTFLNKVGKEKQQQSRAMWYNFFERWETYLVYEWLWTMLWLEEKSKRASRPLIINNESSKKLITFALYLVPRFLPGDEEMVLNIVECLLEIFLGPSIETSSNHESGMSISRIALKKTLWSLYKNRIDFRDLNSVPQKMGPKQQLFLDFSGKSSALPLTKGWTFLPIDELYRNRNILVMDEEVKKEVLIGCLTFGLEIQRAWQETQDLVSPAGDILLTIPPYPMIYPMIVVLSVMKIFLLEGELYRDMQINQLIEDILEPYTLKKSDLKDEISSPVDVETSIICTNNPNLSLLQLEDAANHILEIPFYQFFTDFSASYVAESLGNKLFARLLLTPLATALYPIDYRILVWSDLYEVLNTIEVQYQEVICFPLHLNDRVDSTYGGFLSYFSPVEENKTILQMYVRALVNERVSLEKTPFLYWIAVHHLCGFAFGFLNDQQPPDILENSVPEENHDMNIGEIHERTKLRIEIANAIISRAKKPVIQDWFWYTERNFRLNINYKKNDELFSENRLVMMPKCFTYSKTEERNRRKEWVKEFSNHEFFV